MLTVKHYSLVTAMCPMSVKVLLLVLSLAQLTSRSTFVGIYLPVSMQYTEMAGCPLGGIWFSLL